MPDTEDGNITVLAHSSPVFAQDTMFFRVMDATLTRYKITRVITEQGSAVAAMAAHWCKLHRVKFVVVLSDPKAAPYDDRFRRYHQMADELPNIIFIFDTFEHMDDFGAVFAESISTPIHLVFTKGMKVHYEVWAHGMPKPRPGQMADSEHSLDVLRKKVAKKPKRKRTEEEKKAAKAEENALYNAKMKLQRQIKGPVMPSAIHRRSKANAGALRRRA
jgi:hypothetical protein